MTFEQWYNIETIFGHDRQSIVEWKLDESLLKLSDLDDYLQQAYNAGYDQGRECGFHDGLEVGKP